MNSQRTFLLGLFFVLALGVLGYYTLFMTDFTMFSNRPELVVHFPEARGLREGDTVMVAGVRWGRVKGLTFDPTADRQRRITTTLLLQRELELREGHEIRIEDSTLLGGHNVYIEPGPPGAARIATDGPLLGVVRPNAIERIGGMFEGEDVDIGGVIANLDGLITEARTGEGIAAAVLNDATMRDSFTQTLSNVESASEKLDEIAAKLTTTEGTIGALINSREIYEELLAIGDSFAQLFEDLGAVGEALKGTEGMVGMALNDPEMAQDFKAALESIRIVVDGLRDGKGSFGQFLTTTELSDNLNTLLDALASSEGTIGALINERDAYDKINKFLDDATEISEAIANSDGTLGKLIMDDDLYTEITRAVRLMTRSLEEFREAAPITTFTSVLFGAF